MLQLQKVLRLKETPTFVLVWQTLTTFCAFHLSCVTMIADIVVAVLAIILLLITMIVATIVLNNFGRGLKKQSEQSLVFDCIKLDRLMFLFATVAKNMPEHQRGKSVSDYRGPMSGHPYRMSID